MQQITTLTLNPALDATIQIDEVKPNVKLRCDSPRRDPGGGGVNVSRALKRLGVRARTIYAKGGVTGDMFFELLDKEDIEQDPFQITGQMRENINVMEKSTGDVYRFVNPGAPLSEEELEGLFETLKTLDTEFLVASGSLPPGVPEDTYARLSRIAGEQEIKFVLDTSGPALQNILEAGAHLIKPNLEELAGLTDHPLDSRQEQRAALSELVRQYDIQAIVLSLGPEGAMLATAEGVTYQEAPSVKKRNTVGAGDSMTAGLVHHLANGASFEEALTHGIACGSAAIMTAGTELLQKENVEQLMEKMVGE